MHEFKLWGPRAKSTQLKLQEEIFPMQGPDDQGWWTLCVDHAECGMDYMYLLDDDPTPYPDPRSLWQPKGVHGPSRLYDHAAFKWTDMRWQPAPIAGSIIYELHVGTFSEEGTFDGAIAHLDHLVDLGITHIELMPVAEFAGDRGWGYDGVALFAVAGPYGGADGLKRFVDACHAKNLAVILDVVYNHFGPVGNYANKFGPYLTEKYKTPWGDAVNFTEGGSDHVRRFFCDNAEMFLRDYHVDGLRLDAVHEFIDRGAVKFMEQLSAEVEQLGATLGKKLTLIAESDLNDPRVVRSLEAGGFGMDAQWSDDFHHSLFTMIYNKEPGRGYYDDFGTMDDLVKSIKHVFVYDGKYSGYRQYTHGRPVEGLSAHHFLGYIQNHDQVGNRALGERLEHLVGLDAAKVALGLVLTAPFVPMLFMGEEFAASSPFLYFADHDDEEMAKLVSEGRKNDFALFGFGEADIPNPEAPETFQRSKLIWSEVQQGKHAEMLAWTKEIIHLRRTTIALNDGDLGHIKVESNADERWLTMKRSSSRVFVNLGEGPVNFAINTGECLCLASRAELKIEANAISLPPMTIAVVQLGSSHKVG
jgi:maltooligosyltrehalose trehalohydrolase